MTKYYSNYSDNWIEILFDHSENIYGLCET